jgi:hypothetical protein
MAGCQIASWEACNQLEMVHKGEIQCQRLPGLIQGQIGCQRLFTMASWRRRHLYMKQPEEFEVGGPEYVCKFDKSLYGLK